MQKTSSDALITKLEQYPTSFPSMIVDTCYIMNLAFRWEKFILKSNTFKSTNQYRTGSKIVHFQTVSFASVKTGLWCSMSNWTTSIAPKSTGIPSSKGIGEDASMPSPSSTAQETRKEDKWESPISTNYYYSYCHKIYMFHIILLTSKHVPGSVWSCWQIQALFGRTFWYLTPVLTIKLRSTSLLPHDNRSHFHCKASRIHLNKVNNLELANQNQFVSSI